MVEKAHIDDFEVSEPLIMVHIGNSIGSDLSIVYPTDVYACASGWWRLYPDRAEAYQLVLARNSDHVLGAFRVKRWIPRPDDDGQPRLGFIGEPAEMSIQLEYVGKRVPDRFRTGRRAERYVNPGE